MHQDTGEPHFKAATGHTDEVVYAVTGSLGRARLNRPKAINSLTTAMCASLLAQLQAWADDPSISAVLLDGAGDRGLCAGGDVRAMREEVLAGRPEAADEFWETEYALNQLIADFPKPYVAWMDGVVMGGGVGVSAHGSLRLVTERTKVAMPETIIGFFPDVGARHLLAHATGELGTHLALTGATVTGADAVELGLADRLVHSGDHQAWVQALASGNAEPTSATAAEPAATGERGGSERGGSERSEAPLLAHRSWVDECYQGDDAAVIVRTLHTHDSPAAREAAEVIEQRSPHSVRMTLAALREARTQSLTEVLGRDMELARDFKTHPDFLEGVRAQLVDKDKSPQWRSEPLI